MFRSTCRLFQIAYEGDFWSLCTVTFWKKVDFLISNAHKNSRLYGQVAVLNSNTSLGTFWVSHKNNHYKRKNRILKSCGFNFWTKWRKENILSVINPPLMSIDTYSIWSNWPLFIPITKVSNLKMLPDVLCFDFYFLSEKAPKLPIKFHKNVW